ncbi:MAG TPA: ketoacyl-ACP synthase III [Candidatus Solibacter sp.]|nr:ketoacyl-ACP synthase III [Candidatus Solibacter sp.]
MSPHPDRSRAAITAIEYYLPDAVLTNDQLASEYPEWPVAKIVAKTGINQRHIAAPDECTSDMAVRAARKLFDSGVVAPGDIDVLLLCTQTPDYFLPTTACIVQDRLGIPTEAGALDFNLGCSGFVYGLGIAKGLIETGQADTVLLVTSDTYSKFIRESDRSVRTLFGDGAAATLIETMPPDSDLHIEAPVWGTDGRGAANLIVKGGAGKSWSGNGSGSSGQRTPGMHPAGTHYLEMNGPEIFNFTVGVVPILVENVLQRTCKTMGDIDLFVFHQANKTLLCHLREKIGIPPERFYLALADCGNTVSSTIPIALKRARMEGALVPGQLALLAGFGVGYSWAGTVVRWPADRR